MASKTAEYIAENTYHYTEEAKKIAERHIELAMQHWRTRMGKDWNFPMALTGPDNSQKTDGSGGIASQARDTHDRGRQGGNDAE